MKNPPAFPTLIKTFYKGAELPDEVIPGMTLRDYFAAKAFPAIYAQAAAYAVKYAGSPFHTNSETGVMVMKDSVKESFRVADEMLKAREVPDASSGGNE